VLTQFRALPEGLSCSFYFDDDGAEPLYSYIRLDDNGRIVSVREKQAISTLANTGAYGFCRYAARPYPPPAPSDGQRAFSLCWGDVELTGARSAPLVRQVKSCGDASEQNRRAFLWPPNTRVA
jgi:hypothetical protein